METAWALKQLDSFLSEGNHDSLKYYFDEDHAEFKAALVSHFWDATHSLASHINDSHSDDDDQLVLLCGRILCYLAENSNPKEFLIVLLEQLDTFKDDTKFFTLLDPLCICLRRHDVKKSRWVLETSFSCILAHLQAVPLPKGETLEEDELPLLWYDSKTTRLLGLIDALIDFLEKYLKDRSTDYFPQDLLTVILKCTLRLFEYPLIHLDFISHNDENDTDSAKTAKRLFKLAISLTGCLQKFFEFSLRFNEQQLSRDIAEPFSKDEDTAGLDNKERLFSCTGLLCFMYMTLVEHQHAGKYPQVLSGLYNIRLCGDLIAKNMVSSNLHIQRCSLILLRTLLTSIHTDQLTREIWEEENYKKILKLLTDIMTLGTAKEIRRLALECFDSLLRSSNPQAKYLMLVIVFNSTTHVGVKGHIIKVVKDMVDLTLKGKIVSDVFIGKSLFRLFDDIFKLPEGAASDLVQSADWIISSLNFLLYLILADLFDKSTLWHNFNRIETSFLDPIRSGIELSEVHYKQERDNISSGQLTTLEVCGMDLPPLTKEQKQGIMENSLVTLDLIRSILCRVCEAAEIRKRKTKI